MDLKKNRLFKSALTIIIVLLMAALVYAQPSPFSGDGTSSREETVVNKTCPVMGGKVAQNTPYRVTYKGRVVGFCCPDCIEAFNSSPEKYMESIESQKTA